MMAMEAFLNFLNAELNTASKEGNHERVTQLLAIKGININAIDDSKHTPLISAIQMGHDTIVDLLLEHGADPNVSDHWGFTALMLACERGHAKMVKGLLTAGAAWGDGFTELLFGIRHPTVIAILTTLPLPRINEGLMAAIKAEQSPQKLEVVKLLIDAGADVHFKGMNDLTALQLTVAAEKEYASVVKRLLEAGAARLGDEALKDLFSIAEKRGHSEIRQLLIPFVRGIPAQLEAAASSEPTRSPLFKMG